MYFYYNDNSELFHGRYGLGTNQSHQDGGSGGAQELRIQVIYKLVHKHLSIMTISMAQ